MNWKEETIDKLRKYPAMVSATRSIPLELQGLEREARAVQSLQTTNKDRKNRQTLEERLMNIMVKRQELERQLDSAENWVTLMEEALKQMNEQEKKLLIMLYAKACSPRYICTMLQIEKSSLYRRRDAALKKLTLAMYGALES